jgi:hypothetical protein
MQKSFGNPSAWLGRKLAVSYVVVVTLMMFFAGSVALNEGLTRFLQPFFLDDAPTHAQQLLDEMYAEPTVANITEVSLELGYLAAATTPERFVESKLPQQGAYFANMPTVNQVLLVTHVLTGVFCLLIGGFQFWPQFRKRFKKLHRTFGAVYIITAPISVVLAFVYMALTEPHNLYAHFVGWVALWLFGGLAIIAIVMAVRAIMNKRPYEHQAWMAISFGCLIVAPMFRWNWVLLAFAFPSIDQETLNLVTLSIMLPEVLLIGYGLSLVNRQYQRPMTRRPPAQIALITKQYFLSSERILQAVGILVAAIMMFAYFFGDGVLSLAPIGQIPQALIDQEKAFFNENSWVGPLFAVVNIIALFTGLKLLNLLFGNTEKQIPTPLISVFSITTLITLSICIAVGRYIGLEPDMALVSGGTTYSIAGVILAGFLLLFVGAWYVNQKALMKESLVFITAVIPFIALLLGALWGLSFVPLPSQYIADGQGYMLPSGSAFSLLFIAMFYVVYGQATREHG